MPESMNRRVFLQAASAGMALGLTTQVVRAEPAAADKIVVAIMGTGGRGTQHAKLFAEQPGVEVAYVCDVDSGRMNRAAEQAAQVSGGKTPRAVTDYRRILEDRSVDALVIATCNHWHAPAAIAACCAGKHVYVEKPCSHTPREGELLIEAARKHKRHVQMGNQRRTWPKVIEGVELVRNGEIGRAYMAQSWYTNNRESIGRGKTGPIPEGLDYDLWQGPAPRKPFRTNYLHYNWHWFWNWGNGELGNNGVHMIDLCRWGLCVDYPVRVTSAGGRYAYEDDQETPDTHVVSFEFDGRKSITWEGLSCSQLPQGRVADVVFVGDKGTLTINGGGYTLYDPKGKEVKKANGPAGDQSHIVNFLDAIRGKSKLTSEIEEGHKSTLLCHLGNIAHRTGRSLRCNTEDGRILNDKEALGYWQREYEKGWEPKVS